MFHLKKNQTLLLFLWLACSVTAQPTLPAGAYWPVDEAEDLRPGAVLKVQNKGRLKTVTTAAELIEQACDAEILVPERRRRSADLYIDYTDLFKKTLDSYFNRPYGLPAHSDLKKIEQVRLHLTEVDEVAFPDGLATLPLVLPHLSCDGLQWVYRQALRDRGAVFVSKRIEGRKGRLIITWEGTGDDINRRGIEDLILHRSGFRWDPEGRLLLTADPDKLPVMMEQAAVDPARTGEQIGGLLTNEACRCDRIIVRSVEDIPGLTAFYPFEWNCEDRGRHGLNGLLIGGAFTRSTSGRVCAGLREDGRFSIPREHSRLLNPVFNRSFTISFRVKMEAPRPGERPPALLTLFRKSDPTRGDDPRNGLCLVRDLAAGRLRFALDGWIDREPVLYRAEFSLTASSSYDEWDHYVLTADRNEDRLTLYRNGVALPLVRESGRLSHRLRFDNNAEFNVGKRGDHEYSHRLQLDDLAIFDRPFTKEEVKLLDRL